MAIVYPPKVDSARSVYTNALQCGTCDFAAGGISTP